MTRDPQVTTRIMSKVRNRDTGPEMLLRRELHRRGLRYRLRSTLPGRPDLLFTRARVAVFVDGDYWHGNTWKLRGAQSFEDYYGKGNNATFWLEKIERNVQRDATVNATLHQRGWQVLRLWESDLCANLHTCADQVQRAINAGEHHAPDRHVA